MKKGKILIVDDNEDILFTLKMLLRPLAEQVTTLDDPREMLPLLSRVRHDVILLDMNFCRDAISGQEGFDYLEEILSIDPKAIVIFMTAYSDTEKAVRAIKAGATDFISKPWEKEKLLATLFSAVKLSKSRKEVDRLQEQVTALRNDASLPELIGESPAMRQVKDTIFRLSDTDANILILGENGTGKDLVARMLKHFSPRATEAFVTIDLGSIPEQLFESELFGYEKGAFTDAHKSKPGRMEMASGGTLFLDEIGNLSLPMQAKLLTALEKRQIVRLGTVEPVHIDVRLICATNAQLLDKVHEGSFRQDLLYRINTIELHIPPLRERGEDIILLAQHFLDTYNRKYHKSITGLNREARNKLLKYAWPGNVRELQNRVKRAVLVSENPLLELPELNTGGQMEHTNGEIASIMLPLKDEKIEKESIIKALQICNGHREQAARLLKINPATLYRKMKKYGLR